MVGRVGLEPTTNRLKAHPIATPIFRNNELHHINYANLPDEAGPRRTVSRKTPARFLACGGIRAPNSLASGNMNTPVINVRRDGVGTPLIAALVAMVVPRGIRTQTVLTTDTR